MESEENHWDCEDIGDEMLATEPKRKRSATPGVLKATEILGTE